MQRQKKHLRDSQKGSTLPFHNAINKYGIEKFKWEIIQKENNIQKLRELEKKFIKEFNSFEKGYNRTLGGEGTFGLKFTREQNAKNSERKKNYFQNEVNRKKVSKAVSDAIKKNPNLTENHSKFMTERFKLNDNRLKASAGMKKYLSNNDNRLKHSIIRGAKPFKVLKDGLQIGEWVIQGQCAEMLGLNKSHISRCLNGIIKSYKGFTFEYI